MIRAHREYFNQLAPDWDNRMADDPALWDYLIRFGVTVSDRVLDVGSGTGRLTKVMTEIVGDNGLVIALDVADAMVRVGHQQHHKSGSQWVCGDIHMLGMKSITFDKVICFSAFPHFHDAVQVLDEIFRVLRPGGKMLILHTCSSAALNTFHSSLEGVVKHDRLLSANELIPLMEKVGLTPVCIEESDDLYWVEAKK